MTVSSIYHGSTTTPLAHVRTVQVKSKPVGWLECTANEFLRLLAEHEAGKIDLLKMPEYANDDADTGTDEPVDERTITQPSGGRAQTFGTRRTPGATFASVRQVLARATEPMFVDQIAHQAQSTPAAVRLVLQRNPRCFVCADVDGHAKRWVAIRDNGNKTQ